MESYLKWLLVAFVVAIVGVIVYRNYRAYMRKRHEQLLVDRVMYHQKHLMDSDDEIKPETELVKVDPITVRSEMERIANEFRYLLDHEADEIMNAVYSVWLRFGANENVCLFTETLEATLAETINHRRSCYEKQEAVSILIRRLTEYVTSMFPEHYSDSLSRFNTRQSGVLLSPTDSNWIQSIVLG